jgi:AAA domain (dynein-related subfamily)
MDLQELKLRLATAKTVWVETTNVANRPGFGPWAFGRCLWSPSRYRDGKDRYSLMREVVPGDLVIHFAEAFGNTAAKRAMVGFSVVESGSEQIEYEPPQAGAWAGQAPYYRTPLRDFFVFDPSIAIESFIEKFGSEILKEITESEPTYFPFIKYAGGVRLAQGGYLTRATPHLADTIVEALNAQTVKLLQPPRPPSIWQRNVASAPPELSEILDEKEGSGTGRGYERHLTEWTLRHQTILGGGLSKCLLLDDVSKKLTARSGSLDADDRRVFWIVGNETKENYAKVFEQTLEKSPRVGAIILFGRDKGASGGFSITGWYCNGAESFFEALAADVTVDPIGRFRPTKGTVVLDEPREPHGIEISDDVWARVIPEDVLTKRDLRGLEGAALRAVSALRAGMNVILVGPPGCGKTTLAEALFEAAGIPYDTRCASDHWTTFETIGGYFPEPGDQGGTRLVFRPGAILDSIQRKRGLVLDEINRADIDKAFGELFTVFGGRGAAALRLPLEIDENGTRRRLVLSRPDPTTGKMPTTEPREHTIAIPHWWRMIGSMNDADRASLKRFSLAFARRFAMVPLDLPDPVTYTNVDGLRLLRSRADGLVRPQGAPCGVLMLIRLIRLAPLWVSPAPQNPVQSCKR